MLVHQKHGGGLDGKYRWFSVRTFGRRAFGIYMAVVLILITLFAPFLTFPFKKDMAAFNLLWMTAALLLGTVAVKLTNRLPQKLSELPLRRFRIVIALSSMGLLIIQGLIVKSSWFVTGWDVGALVYPESTDALWYYSTYPNQLFLAGLFEKVGQIGLNWGFSNKYLCNIVVSCICVTSSIALSSFIARRMAGSAAGLFVFVLGALTVGISPWVMVPYSDTLGMPWTTLILWFYVCCRRKLIRSFGIVLCALIGYVIKPTVVFALIAILCAEAPFALQALRRGMQGGSKTELQPRILHLAQHGLAFGIAALIAFPLIGSIRLDTETNPDKGLSATHYLMMGFNPEARGVYDTEDVLYSGSVKNPSDRQKANLERWGERVAQLGLGGTASLFVDKTCINYSDGSFAWKCEGTFYQTVEGSGSIIPWFYGIDRQPNPFETPAQIIWFFILIGSTIACLSRRKLDRRVNAIAIALLLLSLFLTLFECRARYLLLYIPYFTILGALGWSCLKSHRITRRG